MPAPATATGAFYSDRRLPRRPTACHGPAPMAPLPCLRQQPRRPTVPCKGPPQKTSTKWKKPSTIPGRSNAINIAERLGLPNVILDNARKLYGTGSAEINGIIVDMERFKQNFQKDLHEAQHYMKLSRKHHESLLAAKQKITEHGMIQSSKKVQAILGTAAVARSLLRKKLQQFRESTKNQNIEDETKDNMAHPIETLKQPSSGSISTGIMRSPASNLPTHGSTIRAEKKMKIPEVGEMVHVRSLGKKAMVLKVEASKEEIVVQASNMKLKLKLSDVESQKVRTL